MCWINGWNMPRNCSVPRRRRSQRFPVWLVSTVRNIFLPSSKASTASRPHSTENHNLEHIDPLKPIFSLDPGAVVPGSNFAPQLCNVHKTELVKRDTLTNDAKNYRFLGKNGVEKIGEQSYNFDVKITYFSICQSIEAFTYEDSELCL